MAQAERSTKEVAAPGDRAGSDVRYDDLDRPRRFRGDNFWKGLPWQRLIEVISMGKTLISRESLRLVHRHQGRKVVIPP